MSDVVLGIDIGTSGVRIAATDSGNRVLALSTAAIVAPLQNGGRILQDPAIWWQAVDQAMTGLDLKDHRVRGLAVDGTSGTILMVDDKGRPQGLASMYNDVAEAGDLATLAGLAPRETAALGSTSPLARALTLQAEGLRLLHQADWIAGQFSGRFDTTDENNALKTGYDPVARQWPAWIARTGLAPAVLPRVVPVGTQTGTLQASTAKHYGLPSDAAVVAGTTDGCAAFLASGASEEGDGVTSLGTTLTIKLLSAAPVFAPQFGIYSHRIGDQWLAGGASNTGGAALAKYFSRDDMARLMVLLKPDEPTGLDYYPLPQPGERFPVNDPTLEPRLEPRPADERVFFQAMLEGIARIEAQAYAKLAALGASPLASIRTTGGGASNAAWTALRLRALGVPGRASLSEQAAVGTARLAWRGLGHAN